MWDVKKEGNMKFIFGMQINIEVFYKLVQSFWVYIAKHTQNTQNKFAYLCNILRTTFEMRLTFYLQINTNVFYSLIVSLWLCVASHSQSTENNKFATSLQYFKENVKDEVGFLTADNYQRFFQIDSMIDTICLLVMKVSYKLILWFWWGWSSILKFPNKQVCNVLTISQRRSYR